MSSYLNFYVKLKDVEKPIFLMEYSRNNPVYGAYLDTLHPKFSYEELKYTEITAEKASMVTNDKKADLECIKKDLQEYINAFNTIKNPCSEAINTYLESYGQYIESIKDEEETIRELEFIEQLIPRFDKILITID